jgi:hypothetical protein
MDDFGPSFEHNFYLTEEYARFCSKIANIPLKKRTVNGQVIYTLKNKNVAISNYSGDLCREFKRQKITHLRVTPEFNHLAPRPSLMEYAIFHKTTYEEAFKKYRTSFFHGLREGRKFPHQVRVVRRPDGQLVGDIYRIYTDQMKRHNSYHFPLSFFETFLASPSALLFLIEYQQQVIAYFCCFQHHDNIYASIGGGNPRYFSHKSSNKLYDELIRYACQNGLNIHLGIGEHAAGYQKFKRNAGLSCYRVERFPDDDNVLRLSIPFLKFRLTGKVLDAASSLFPHLVTYISMPFT